MPRKEKPFNPANDNPQFYIEVIASISDEWFFNLCKEGTKEMVMMSRPFHTFAECFKYLQQQRAKKSIDPNFSVVIVNHYKMVSEQRADMYSPEI